MSAANWFWPVSEAEGAHIAETGIEWCFPPGEPIEIRVIPDERVTDDA